MTAKVRIILKSVTFHLSWHYIQQRIDITHLKMKFFRN